MDEPVDQSPTTGAKTPAGPPAMPRWVKVSSIAIGGLLLLFLILKLTGLGGEHGPGLHQSGAATADMALLAAAQPADVSAGSAS